MHRTFYFVSLFCLLFYNTFNTVVLTDTQIWLAVSNALQKLIGWLYDVLQRLKSDWLIL